MTRDEVLAQGRKAAAQANSKYNQAYCNEVIECLARGHSIAGFAGEIGVGRRTVFDWAAAHPEFSRALEIATPKAVLFWELQLIECARTGKGNITAIIFGLKNRAHEDWRDVHRMEVGKPGDFNSMTDEELDDFIARGQGAIGAGHRREIEARGTKEAAGSRRLN